MILKQYYEQKKEKAYSIVNAERGTKDTVDFKLYNDSIFKGDGSVTFPLILFKYNDVQWQTSSEKEYKADVDFSIFIVLEPSFKEDYAESFELAAQIDQAILLDPTKSEIKQNRADLMDGKTTVELITNAAFKVRERQYTVEEDHWQKNDYYIWEICYKTTLVDKAYKKPYAMISNDFFVQEDIDGAEREKELRENLRKIGFDLDDYHLVQYNGKDLLIYKDIDEQLSIDIVAKSSLPDN